METNVAIIGGGITGLACARKLQDAGIPFTIYESTDRVGGRVRSEKVDGYTLDVGFQIFFESYEEIRFWLDPAVLQLGHFFSGATVYDGSEKLDFANPLEEGITAIPAAFDKWATLTDKAKLTALYLTKALKAEAFPPMGTSTLTYLQGEGYSDDAMRRLFRPFFGDVFLDRGLSPDAGFFLYLLRKFATTKGSLPAEGMGSIGLEIAKALKPDSIKLRTPMTGDSWKDAHTYCVQTVPDTTSTGPVWHGTVNLYLGGEMVKQSLAKLELNAQAGLLHCACVVSEAQPDYAPAGKSLLSVSLGMGAAGKQTDELLNAVRPTLEYWYGDLSGMQVISRFDVPHSLPLSKPHDSLPYHRTGKLYRCGDAYTYPSMNGAAFSGRKVAEAIIAEAA